MNAKKIFAVAVTLCLLLCAMLPMAASAVELGAVEQYPTANPDDGSYAYDMTAGGTAFIEIAAGETAVIVAEGATGAEFAGYGYDTENFEDAQYFVILSRMMDGQYWATGNTSGTLAGDFFQIYNANEFAIYFKFAVGAGGGSTDPVGSYNNPEALPDMGVFMGGHFTHDFIDATEPYFYKWTAVADGEFSVTIIGTDGPNGVNSVGWTYCLENPDGNAYGDMHWSSDDPVATTDSISVSTGDVVTVMLGTYDPTAYGYPLGGVTFQVGFQQYGSSDLPYPLSAGVNEYNIVDDLNHYAYTATTDTKIVLSGAGAAWEFVENDYDELTADANGNYTFVLAAGESIVLNPAPTSLAGSDITFTVAEKGSEEWPIEVVADEEYTSPNTFWPGAYFTFAAEQDGVLVLDFGDYTDWLVTVGETEYYGEGQVSYLELDVATGETVFNIMDWGWSWDGKFTVEFEPDVGTLENPYEVDAVGKLTNTTVAAGETVYYAVNSKLDGTTLTVTGDVVVKVNGNEVDAKNGYTLKAEGATIQVTITNNGTADATYEAVIEPNDNPKTGVSIALPVLAMLMSACGAVVIGKKKF